MESSDLIYGSILLLYVLLFLVIAHLVYKRQKQRKWSIQHSDTKSILQLDSLRKREARMELEEEEEEEQGQEDVNRKKETKKNA